MVTKISPKNPEHRRVWIKHQLELAGFTYATIGRELGVTRHCVRRAMVIHYPKMERAIAAKLGMRPEDIWPERYAA